MKFYRAPWSNTLKWVSLLVTVLCAGFAVFLWFRFSSPRNLPWAPYVWPLPLVIMIWCGLFTVRGYSVGPDAILVHRLLWSTRLPLASLESVRYEPDAMRQSIRIFGNGGAYSFSGSYRNRLLGSYRAFVTDLHRTVVLRFPGRTVVISPDAPEQFVSELTYAVR